tara:strand:+ start:381 stop:578 length:198 start_codon:yes stop_codon:yes gene_type:complete
MFKVVDSMTQHDETDTDFLMILAFLDPKDGFSHFSQSEDGAPIVHDRAGNSGELHAADYHIEVVN